MLSLGVRHLATCTTEEPDTCTSCLGERLCDNITGTFPEDGLASDAERAYPLPARYDMDDALAVIEGTCNGLRFHADNRVPDCCPEFLNSRRCNSVSYTHLTLPTIPLV